MGDGSRGVSLNFSLVHSLRLPSCGQIMPQQILVFEVSGRWKSPVCGLKLLLKIINPKTID